MSNHLAVAAVTATLVDVLQAAVRRDVAGAEVIAARPGTAPAPDTPEVHVYLYRVEPNAQWRNADLPTRSGTGAVMTRPQAALDLHYLLSFHGHEGLLEPHRLLGSVVRHLHAEPVLSRDLIAATAQGAAANDLNAILGLSDLQDQVEQVRLTPVTLELDEMSSLWSVFPDTPYSLSVAYRASVVLISPDTVFSPGPPVRERALFVETIRRPHIDRVEAAAGPTQPVEAGTPIVIQGSQLQGEITVAWFGGVAVSLAPAAVHDRSIELAVPANVRPGLLPLRIEHRRAMGEPPQIRSAGQSNAVPLLVRPRIGLDPVTHAPIMALSAVAHDDVAGTTSAILDLRVVPAVGRTQQVTVHLVRIVPPSPPGTAPYAMSANDPSRDLDGEPAETDSLSIPLSAVRDGTYVVRIQVDGAESVLERDEDPLSPTFRQFIGPRLVIP